MSDRITNKDLESTVALIQKKTNTPENPYERIDGKLVAQPGNYHLDYAYGGVQLVQMCNEGGGCRNVLNTGFTTKRECFRAMRSYLQGLYDAE